MAWQCRLPDDMKSLLSTLRGEDAFNEAWLEEDEDDDWNEDDYDVEVQYVR
jgi:23S rRNA pseudouridine1911/1915/1917 synthase